MDYQKIARIISKERCDRHKLKSIAIAKNDSIELICCCDYFKQRLIKLIEKELKNQDTEDIKNFLQII
jgi:hypothetical protein